MPPSYVRGQSREAFACARDATSTSAFGFVTYFVVFFMVLAYCLLRSLCSVLSGLVLALHAAFCRVRQVATDVPVICFNLDRLVSATPTVASVSETVKKGP